MGLDDRRVADEAFRRELAERMKALEIGLERTSQENKEIISKIAELNMANLELHYTLFGGPKTDDVGLIEKIRALLWKAGIAITCVTVVVAFIGRLVSPLYDKFITEYLYNSVSEKWMREHSQPKVIHKHFVIQQPKDD